MSNKTPETLTAVKRAEQLSIGGNPSPASSQNIALSARNEKYASTVRQALSIGTINNAMANIDPHQDIDSTFMILGINEIDPYRHNPRTGPNPRYAEIKASIRADQITNTLTVTRRPSDTKYTPYGGGNTRLLVAKELYEEGDQRFAKLNVLVKIWPGDANVISAHLAENENRGDISFWEKAKGVNGFKVEFERENSRILTAGELNKELRQRGINFGIKTIQNFAFSVDYLSPIGPWLKAAEVNTIIRPGVSSLIELAEKMDIASAMKSTIQAVFDDQAATLKREQAKNEDLEVNDQVIVSLNAIDLIGQIHSAASAVVGCLTRDIPLMLSALASDSRITAEALKAIKVTAETDNPASSATTPDAHKQRALPGMLRQVPASAGPERKNSFHDNSGDLGEQAAISGKGPASGSSNHTGTDPVANVLNILIEINSLVPLADVTLTAPAMPFGYLMDMPASIRHMDGQEVQEPELRAAVWKFLVAMSGQLDSRNLGSVSPEVSTWCALIQEGPQAFEDAYITCIGGKIFEATPYVALGEISWIFAEDEIGLTLIKLLQAMEQIRLTNPERFTNAEPARNS
jgi:ParB family protein of integrating conjugative element (PFGI_1 class)